MANWYFTGLHHIDSSSHYGIIYEPFLTPNTVSVKQWSKNNQGPTAYQGHKYDTL